MYSFINGIDVLISTPLATLRLYEKCPSLLDEISYVVSD